MSDTNPNFGPYNNATPSQGGQNGAPGTNPAQGYGTAQPHGANAAPAYGQNGQQAQQPGQTSQAPQPGQASQPSSPLPGIQNMQGGANSNYQRPQQGYTPRPSMAQGQPMGGARPYQAAGAAPSFGMAGIVPSSMPYYGCSFPEAVKRFFTKYVVFSGRASRSEYWWTQLFLGLAAIVISIFNTLIFGQRAYLQGIWDLVVLIPTIALTIRRLHDSNKSGWWIFLPYGLLFGGIVLVIVFVVLGVSMGEESIEDEGAGFVIVLLGMLACMLAYFVTWLVLMIAKSDPAGARFDNNVLNPMAFNAATTAMPMNRPAAQPSTMGSFGTGATRTPAQPTQFNTAARPTQTPATYTQKPAQPQTPGTQGTGTAPTTGQTQYGQPKQPSAAPQYANPASTPQTYKAPQYPSQQNQPGQSAPQPGTSAPQPGTSAPQPGQPAPQQGYRPYGTQNGTPAPNGNTTPNGGQPNAGNGYGQTPRQ